ncbi:MAG: 2-C-methyl-D-erythritol 4-phosphate cytidylyltransferase [Odoribacter sp.]|nr:2-C-methyl-D-erythritol 4-phosphate cytidylyltransferase [Odoribacter sp.]
MKNIGIILAGGSGQRMGNELPKQFLPLAGQTILEYSLDAFQENEGIDEIFIVTRANFIEKTEEILKQHPCSKVTQILAGGSERYHSTLAALKACPETDCNLIIHDAVRPLVSQQMISDCIAQLHTYSACTTAVPTTDTILCSDTTRTTVQEIPNRHFLFNVQTPQAFRKSVLVAAYEKMGQDLDFHPTDDCGVVHKFLPKVEIKIIPGSHSNLKITYPEDLVQAEKLLSVQPRSSVNTI